MIDKSNVQRLKNQNISDYITHLSMSTCFFAPFECAAGKLASLRIRFSSILSIVRISSNNFDCLLYHQYGWRMRCCSFPCSIIFRHLGFLLLHPYLVHVISMTGLASKWVRYKHQKVSWFGFRLVSHLYWTPSGCSFCCLQSSAGQLVI